MPRDINDPDKSYSVVGQIAHDLGYHNGQKLDYMSRLWSGGKISNGGHPVFRFSPEKKGGRPAEGQLYSLALLNQAIKGASPESGVRLWRVNDDEIILGYWDVSQPLPPGKRYPYIKASQDDFINWTSHV